LLIGYTYYFGSTGVPTTKAKAIVFDAVTNAVVRSLDITALMPTDTTEIDVAVSFPSVVALNSSRDYLLAVCLADDPLVAIAFAANDGANSLQACIGTNAECQAAGGLNRWYASGSNATIRTTISGSCPLPLPSPMALCGRLARHLGL
jgi:hypothetical protein